MWTCWMSTFLTWTSWAVPYKPSQTFTVITSPWFLLYASCLVNIAAEIHYLIFSLPVLLFSFRWVSVNNMWIIPVSCELLLGPSALPFFSLAHRCMILPSGLKRLPPFHCDSLWFWSKRKSSVPRETSSVQWSTVAVSARQLWLLLAWAIWR